MCHVYLLVYSYTFSIFVGMHSQYWIKNFFIEFTIYLSHALKRINFLLISQYPIYYLHLKSFCCLLFLVQFLTFHMHNHQKDKIYYIHLDPCADYVSIVYLNTRLCDGWITLHNLNLKLKFQTQILNSNLNFKTKIFPVLPGNPEFLKIDSNVRRN